MEAAQGGASPDMKQGIAHRPVLHEDGVDSQAGGARGGLGLGCHPGPVCRHPRRPHEKGIASPEGLQHLESFQRPVGPELGNHPC